VVRFLLCYTLVAVRRGLLVPAKWLLRKTSCTSLVIGWEDNVRNDLCQTGCYTLLLLYFLTCGECFVCCLGY